MRKYGVYITPVVLAIVVGAIGCLGDDSGPEYRISWASADSVEVLSVSPLTVQFDVSGSKPTPCHEIIEPVITEDTKNRQVTVRMRSRVATDVVCVTVIGSYEKTIDVRVSTSGVWDFVFPDGLGGETTVPAVTLP